MIRIEYPGGLSAAVEKAKSDIDIAAGAARSRYITTVPGQSETYTEKAAEAKRYLADNPSSDVAVDYPWVAADSEAFGVSFRIAAEAIIEKHNQWKTLGSTIEMIRLRAKEDAAAATSPMQCATIARIASETLGQI